MTIVAERIEIEPSGQSCGASLRGVDLTKPVPPETMAAIRKAWLEHQVLAFPDQHMSDDDLERFTLNMGVFGDDPFFFPIPGRAHIAEVRRNADEKTPIFAEAWHSDWSFLPNRPSATLLHSRIVPPVGGDTLFANQYAAYDALSPEMKQKLEGMNAVHSAARGYAKDGIYGENDKGRSMTIRFSDDAKKKQTHPVVRTHPETGRKALAVNMGYTIAIEGMGEEEGWALLVELFQHQTQAEFRYVHKWKPNMLLMWDNRCVLHRATGGYEGHERSLRRTTVAGP